MNLMIGNNPVKRYLLYALTAIQNENLVLKARGKAITKAVDLAEIIKRKLPEVKVSKILIDTAIIKDKESQRDIRVSTMEIYLVRSKQ